MKLTTETLFRIVIILLLVGGGVYFFNTCTAEEDTNQAQQVEVLSKSELSEKVAILESKLDSLRNFDTPFYHTNQSTGKIDTLSHQQLLGYLFAETLINGNFRYLTDQRFNILPKQPPAAQAVPSTTNGANAPPAGN